MKNCLIVCSQPLKGAPDYLTEELEDAFLIAVDGGIEHFRKMKLQPAVWVGDGDSLKRPLSKNSSFKRLKLPKAKDYTDLEFALHIAGRAFLAGEWEGDIIIVGAQGGRFDHEFGNLLVVQRWLIDMASTVGPHHCPNVFSYGELGIWVGSVDEVEFRHPKGAIFSVLCPGVSPRLTITGAKYNLRSKPLDHGSMGLSNEGLGRRVRVTVDYPKKSPKVEIPTSPVFVLFPA